MMLLLFLISVLSYLKHIAFRAGRHAQNHTNRQHRAKIQVCLIRFITNTIQWPLGMLIHPISPISINVMTNLPKYTLNKTVHTIHRKNINPANQPSFRPRKQTEYEKSPKKYLIPGCNNLVSKSVLQSSQFDQYKMPVLSNSQNGAINIFSNCLFYFRI